MSLLAVGWLLWAVPSVPEVAQREVRQAFEHVGRSAPVEDPVLSSAAQKLAQEALERPSGKLGDTVRVAHAVSNAGGFDPSPRALFLRTSPPAEVLKALQGRQDLTSEPATEMGVGWVSDGGRGSLVVLLADRKAQLRPFPRQVGPGGGHPALCGRLREPLAQAQVFVTRPSGAVEKLATRPASNEGFCSEVGFHEDGLYTLEVLGTGPAGPEVAALFFTNVGTSTSHEEAWNTPEPASTGAALTAILDRINALRRANGASEVTLDAALSKVAQAYSDRMAREHFFAHVAPDGSKLADRLHAAGYGFRSAGENLGLASGPLAAHFGIEHSPGHRKNLMDPSFGRLGLGLSTEHVSGRDQTLVTEVLASVLPASGDPLGDAYRTYDGLRAQHHLPALRRSAILERIATEQAQRALSLDQPHADLPGPSVHERVFSSLPGARKATVDLFITSELPALPDSTSLRDPSNDLVGIGAVRGDSPRFGRDRFWVVVVFASTREAP